MTINAYLLVLGMTAAGIASGVGWGSHGLLVFAAVCIVLAITL
jgi:hypothetical protein